MSQSKVTSYYRERRSTRTQNNKGEGVIIKNINPAEEIITKSKTAGTKPKFSEKDAAFVDTNETKPKDDSKKKTSIRGSKGTKSAKASKKGSKSCTSGSQTKVTSFYESTKSYEDPKKVSKAPELSICEEELDEVKIVPKQTFQTSSKAEKVYSEEKVVNKPPVVHSPKRNLSNPHEGTPPKKKTLVSEQAEHLTSIGTPRKLIFPSKNEESSSIKEDFSKTKVNVKTRSEETQKAIANFKEKLALIKSYETNPYKVTAVISPSEQTRTDSPIPQIPAYQRYGHLVDKDLSSSLVLPAKYKLLSEMFRSMDTVVSILNNRKEKITFEKVKEGVQKMMKRTFSKTHLGQMLTVMPSAYNVSLEKSTFKKTNEPDYQLIITPVLHSKEGSSSKSKAKGTVMMVPQDLFDRKKEFDYQLLCLVKDHHKIFLGRLNFPLLPNEAIRRWHPKFQVDLVPDIETAKLPEIPETKICTAKDVLSKIVKSSLKGKQKVVKALKCVADESSTPSNKKTEAEEESKEKLPDSKSALKGVCADLLAKIRARESAKLLQCMTESPDEVKRKAMLERLPKIVQILWHYFIAERKAAVPVDVAIEKIIHSFNSLSTHEEVKAHLTLITETFPGWLSFIQIPKGLYITMDKSKNITKMLDDFRY